MIVAHLIGGNEIEGIRDGKVIVDGEELNASYNELVSVCGNISLGDLDTSLTRLRDSKAIQNDYIKLVQEFDSELGAEFVIDNYLTKEICYSTYKVDFKTASLILEISTYNC